MTSDISPQQDSGSLQNLSVRLQRLIDDLEMSAHTNDWSAMADIDQQVNQLVHFCVSQGNIKSPEIHQKVMFITRLYRRVIEQVAQEREAVALQLKQEKQNQKMANSYQMASNICA